MTGRRTEITAAALVVMDICNRRLNLGIPHEVMEFLLLLAIYFLGDRLRRMSATPTEKADSQG